MSIEKAVIRIAHIITGLDVGGAEMMLYKLQSEMNGPAFRAEVISLTDIGPLGERIRALGVPVRALGMSRGKPNPLVVIKLAIWLRQLRPDVVQTWMYHADLIGGAAAKLAGCIPVAWGIRQSNLHPDNNKRFTLWTAKMCARLSRWLPAKIVCCSEASRRVHVALGYAEDRMTVIPNGFDPAIFKPDPLARRDVRREIGIAEKDPVVGMVARFDPQKDHRNFVKAAGILHKRIPEARFLLIGEGISSENAQLARWLEEAGLGECFHLLGRRQDIPAIFAALDVATSSSCGEGFSNVIGEAMACGVPCVVTDVGDSSLIVGEAGLVVPPSDPEALALAWQKLIALEEAGLRCLGNRGRDRICSHFSLEHVAARYAELYRQLAGLRKGRI